MPSSLGMVLGGTFLIAAGGLVATLGWNSHADDQRRRGLIEQVAAELVVNSNIANDPKFMEEDPARLADFVIFPRFQTVAIDGAIASGLFLRDKDRTLLTRLSNLSELIRDQNNRLKFTESQTVVAPPEVRITWRARLRDGSTRAKLNQKFRLLGDLLLNEYDVSQDRSFFDELPEDAA